MNSYENCVYQVGIESSLPIIEKFYRPERWTREQILEEHQFTLALKNLDISVVAPIQNATGETLHQFNRFQFALYQRQGRHAPSLGNFDTLLSLGRTLGRIHAIGKEKVFSHRPDINIKTFGYQSTEYLLQNQFIPQILLAAYSSLTSDLLTICSERIKIPYQKNRLHGDCHLGNILWREDTAHFVYFDDARNGPAIQDLWMLLSGDRQQQTEQMSELLEGYNEFCEFDLRELTLIETLRSLRIIHYSAWLARRWQDPDFPKYFPCD